jgi:hypothetical protein
MTSLDPRQSAALAAALDRVAHAVAQAAERAADPVAQQTLGAALGVPRDVVSSAQFELRRHLGTVAPKFLEKLREKVARDTLPREPARAAVHTDWQSLTLVEDHEVEAQVGADKLGRAIAHDSEWELRDLDALMGALLRTGRAEQERNPLRPEIIGQSLYGTIESVSKDDEARKVLAQMIARFLAQTMRACYAAINEDLRQRGVQPVSLAVKTVDGPGNEFMRNTSGYGTLSRSTLADESLGSDSSSGGGLTGSSSSGALPSGRGGGSGFGGAGGSRGGGGGSGGGGSGGGGTPMGQVDAQMMALIRRLAWLGNSGGGSGTEFGGTGGGFALTGAATAPGRIAPNIIQAHSAALKQASTGALDHMVIDVVGSLFDQILSDPKVPPQMARQIARLQLPVLRAALGDPTFFSSRRHPVRRFVNRIASLACAFDDFEPGSPGERFIGLVKDLVQEIVAGDFDQMELYESKLGALEIFIAEQTQAEVKEQGDAAALFDLKEDQLRQQQRYMRQLKAALEPVGMQEFMRDFLAQVWSQAIVMATRRDGADGELAKRLRLAGRDLVLSVQPKGTPSDRKDFLVRLPTLMKELNEGLALIGWPEPAKKAFFAQLLPAHAESLKGQSMRQLDRNLLAKQLDTILNAPLPSSDEPHSGSMPLPVLDDVIAEGTLMSAEEAQRVGLVDESAVDWDGQIDIDLSAEPEITEVDINIDGLPPVEPVEPTRGSTLVDHLQLGFAYQMHIEEQWQKVRLAHVSPSRAFFVFTRGKKHQRTISMTQRMVTRLCETGRLRAFENAYLLERATARARKQLAALGASATRH